MYLFILWLCVNVQIEINCWLVLVEYILFQMFVLMLYSILCDGFQQCFFGVDFVIVGGDVQIFYIDIIVFKSGGVVGEEYCVVYCFVCYFVDQCFGFVVVGKQCFFDFFWCCYYFFGGFFVDCEFINYIVDSGGVVWGGLVDCDVYGVFCIYS